MHIPKVRFPEFIKVWDKHNLGEIANFSKGKGIAKADISPDGKTECIRYGELYTTYSETISEVISKTNVNIEELVLSEANDVIIPASGETQIDIATASCVLRAGIALGGDLNIIKTKNDGVFLSYYLNSKKKLNIASLAQGISVVHLYASQLSLLELNLPTIPEQQRIATFLTAVDSKLQALKKKRSLLEEYKKGVMQKLFSQELRFKPALSEVEGDENGKDFPEWEEKYGSDLFESISNKNHNSDLPILAISQEFGAVPREQINYQISVTDKSIDGYKVVEKGDFIISLRSFQGGIEHSNYKGICSPAYIILRSKVEIENTFYRYYFKTDFYIQQLCSKLEGIRDGKMISYKYFSELGLPYPSLPEQTLIANFLSSFDEKIQAAQVQIEKTEVWKRGLLQKMFC